MHDLAVFSFPKNAQDYQKEEPLKPEKPTNPDTPSNPATPDTSKEITLINTEGKKPADVAALNKIIKEQNYNGAQLPENLDTAPYQWDENGRLTQINWAYDYSISGNLGLSELTALEIMHFEHNQLSSLDVSKNTLLSYLRFDENVKVTGWSKSPSM